jgi:hypothetical protein
MIPILLGLWVIGSLIVAFGGARYRFGFWGYLFASLLLTPLMGVLLLAAAVPPKTKR